MGHTVTQAERKGAEAERRRRTHTQARTAGGFLLFGSAARGEMRFDSDVDILVDFPPDAWRDPLELCRAGLLGPEPGAGHHAILLVQGAISRTGHT